MGMLNSYALAGAIEGGADTFLDLSKEQRKDKRELAKEEREQSIWEIRQKRIEAARQGRLELQNKYQMEEAERGRKFTGAQAVLDRDARSSESKLDREGRATESKLDREHRAGESSLTRLQRSQEGLADRQQRTQQSGLDRAAASSEAAIDRRAKSAEPFVASPSSTIVTPRDDGGYDTEQVGHRPATTSTTEQWTPKSVSKEFAALAGRTFGTYANNGYSFGNKLDAQNATRAASMATRMWLRTGGKIDTNSVWVAVHEAIEANPSMGTAQVEQLIADKNNDWYLYDSEEVELKEAETELQNIIKNQWNTDLNQIPGMLSRGSETPLDTQTQEGGTTPPAHLLKEGVNTKFKNGQVWTIRNGKPTKVE